MATVGNQYVFYGDVLPMVNQMLEGPLSKATSEAERAEIESYREQLTKQATRQLVDSKLLLDRQPLLPRTEAMRLNSW